MKAEDMVNKNSDENSFQGSSKSPGKGFTNGMAGRKLPGQSQGLVNGNGLVNGTGMTNGLASDNGFINGSGVTNGFVNGTGVTNGLTNGLTNGMTNGLANDFDNEMRINENAISPKRTSLVLIIVVLLIIPSIFLMYSYEEPVFEGGLRVDGDFSEWDDVGLISDGGTLSIASLDVANYGVTSNEHNDLFIYARSRENWLASANADSLCVFIDNDNDAGTGYIIEGMGAEYMIEVYGWESSIRGKQFSEFNGNDQHNWSAWEFGGSTIAALSGDQIEISVPSTHLSLGNDYKVLLMTKRGGEIGEICRAQFTEGKGALVVEQTPLDVSGVISVNTVLELELNAYGQAVTVNSISLSYVGVGSATVSGLPVTVSVGTPTLLNVQAPIDGLGQGRFVNVAVSSVTSDGSSNIIGNGLKAYANAPPSEISIDGAFADWNTVTRSTDTASDVDNPNVDISNYASVNSTTQAYFYLKVNDNGEMFTGGIVPQAREKPGPAGEPGEPGEPQPPRALPRKTGEDITRIYIDTVTGGQNVGGIKADYLIEVKGIHREITSKKLYSLPGKHFIRNIDAANGIRELEASLSLTEIGYTGVMQVYFETTDWQKGEDGTEVHVHLPALKRGTRGLPGGGYEVLSPGVWSIETVDGLGGDNVGSYPSLALDGNGNPHFSYYNGTGGPGSGELKYANWTGSIWNIETVDGTAGFDVGTWTSLALDGSGYPHISYRNETGGDLKYANWTGSIWNIETVDGSAGGNVGSYTSLALDGSGYPHISYRNATDGSLTYANWTGSVWNIETIDGTAAGDSVGYDTSLALDGSDYPHISYYNITGGRLKYANWTGSVWNIETVDGLGGDNVGSYTSLALDGSGNPHISYRNITGSSLKHANWTGSTWNIETVDGVAGYDVGTWTSLALDGSDYPHISYRNNTGSSLKYANWTGSGWNIETVEGTVGNNVGITNSLFLDGNGNPHIGYYNTSGGDLKYAVLDIPEFQTLIIPILVIIAIPIFIRKRRLGVTDE